MFICDKKYIKIKREVNAKVTSSQITKFAIKTSHSNKYTTDDQIILTLVKSKTPPFA